MINLVVSILVIILCVLAIATLIGLVWLCMQTVEECFCSNYDSRICFSAFKKLYAINPDRFYLRDSRVAYDNNGHFVDLVFTTPIGLLRYKLFLRKIHRARELDREKQLHADMLKNLQDDLNKLLN